MTASERNSAPRIEAPISAISRETNERLAKALYSLKQINSAVRIEPVDCVTGPSGCPSDITGLLEESDSLSRSILNECEKLANRIGTAG